jgi:uncharacterized membrane protein (UPF0127 family)
VSHRAGGLVLRREDDGRVLCDHCVLADTLWRRMRGLIGRQELDRAEAIVLRPSWSVHTFFMRFPIDVVFADADQVVVEVVPDLRPWRWAICRGARDVVELRAGECARTGIAVGQRLAWAAQPGRPPEGSPTPADMGEPALRSSANGTTRVLIGTDDDRFLRLARFLLTRKHFEVDVTKRLVKTVDLVERQHPDVVVIDATSSLAEAARTVAAIEALHPRTAVMVVYDGEPPRWMTGLKVTEKWEALESLADDVELLANDARAAS